MQDFINELVALGVDPEEARRIAIDTSIVCLELDEMNEAA